MGDELRAVLAVSAIFLAVNGRAAEGPPLYVKGRLLASEDFSGDLADWLAEGDVVARVEDEQLYFEATTRTDVKKGNIWWRKHFSGDIQIEYDYASLSDNGLSMFFWNAHGRKGEDLFSWKRNGVYDAYIAGRMNAYHISYHRFGSGVSNFRKSYGFHVVSSNKDPVGPADRLTHHITVYSRGNHIRFLVDGKVIHDFVDEGKPCLSKTKWLHALPCKGTGTHFTEGKIGLRHTQRQRAHYDSFKVYRLVAPGGAGAAAPPAVIVVDDAGPGFTKTGQWNSSTRDKGFEGQGYLWHRKGSGEGKATFSFKVPVSGRYQVCVKWVASKPSDRATNAPFTIHSADGRHTVRVDLSKIERAGKWYSLGVHRFEAGTEGRVVLTNDADNSVVADAAKIAPAE